MRRAEWIGTRWLGVGLASVLAVVTLGLALTGRLDLYINPASSWFAVSMAVVVLAGAAASFALPLGAESDHGHDHGHGHAHPQPHLGSESDREAEHPRHPIAVAATVTGGIAASGVVVLTLVLPPASLSASFISQIFHCRPGDSMMACAAGSMAREKSAAGMANL